MTRPALSMEGVYKRFRKGELYDSLRDLIPALTGRMFRRTDIKADDRDFWALSDVSFAVEKGEAFGIIGRNGAGKSTMLKILSGIMPPTRGRLEVNGRLSAVIEVAAGFHPDLTGRENIYLNGTILGMTRKEIDSKLEAIVEFSGLHEFIDTPVKRYSSGMYARLGFSVCAHVDPEILIVDEVLSVGDFLFQQKCIARMNEVKESGATVIFVSHNLRAVSDLCARSLLLEKGRVAAIDDSHRIIDQYYNSVRTSRIGDEHCPIVISEVLVDGANQSARRFDVGETVTVSIRATAKTEVKDVSILMSIFDEHHYRIFDTSTARLGHEAFNLSAGEEIRCEIQVKLAIAYGSYHFGVALHRYNDGHSFDSWLPAYSFHVGQLRHDYRGVVVGEPRVLKCDVVSEGADVPGSQAATC